MPTASEILPIRFHTALNVTDLGRSVVFYRGLFGQEPAKQKADYAKFELTDPPLVLSLIPGPRNPGGALNHVGLRLPDLAALLQMQARVETAGLATQREAGVACCHSTQTKFWVTDPDLTRWEIYILTEGSDEEEHPAEESAGDGLLSVGSIRVEWRHQIPDPFPARISHDDNSVHAILLEGTVNLSPATMDPGRVFAEAYRVLRPGGEITVHALVGDRPGSSGPPALPGPAAVVQYVPMETEPLAAMLKAGFVQVRFDKLSPEPYFVVSGVGMRELVLVGQKPGFRPRTLSRTVISLGPLARVVDDFGNVFPRGERVALNIHDWKVLAEGPAAGQFCFLPAGTI